MKRRMQLLLLAGMLICSPKAVALANEQTLVNEVVVADDGVSETTAELEEVQQKLEEQLLTDEEVQRTEAESLEVTKETIGEGFEGEEINPNRANYITGGVDMEHATKLALDTEYIGKFTSEQEVVWYKYTTGNVETYYQNIFKNISIESGYQFFAVYSDIGEQLYYSNYVGAQSSRERYERCEPNTTYYIQVANQDKALGNYSLGIYELEDTEGEVRDDATFVTEGQEHTGNLCIKQDVDWFKFVPQYDGVYSFNFKSLTCDYLEFFIYTETEELLGEVKYMDSGENRELKVSLKKGETYYIKSNLSDFYNSSSSVGNYRFSFNNYFPFNDVAIISGHWKYEAVKYVSDHGIMNGISGTLNFNPDEKLNRAMFATILYRMAGEPSVYYDDTFTDVPRGQYYTEAVLWANKEGIVSGFSDGSYGVNENITREQIAKMLYQYAYTRGYNMNTNGSLDSFTDVASINGWAVDYVKWAVGAEMITGKPNDNGSFRIDPKGHATRAECAKMISMFMKKYIEE